MYLFEVWLFPWVIYKLFKQLKCFVGIWSRSSGSTLNSFLAAVTDTWEKWITRRKEGFVLLFGVFVSWFVFPSNFQGFQSMIGCFSVSGPWTGKKLMVEGHGEAVGMTRQQRESLLMLEGFSPPLSYHQVSRRPDGAPCLQAGFLPFISFSAKALMDTPRTLHFTRLLSISQLTQVDHQRLMTYGKPVAYLTSISHNWVSNFEWTVTLTHTLHYLLLPPRNFTNLSID